MGRRNQARISSIFSLKEEAVNDIGVRHALMGAESSGYFDTYVDKLSLRSMARMMRAHSCWSGFVLEALAEFEMHLPDAMKDGMAYMNPVLYADIAWCKFHLAAMTLPSRRPARRIEFQLRLRRGRSRRRAWPPGSGICSIGSGVESKRMPTRLPPDLKILRERQAHIVELCSTQSTQAGDRPEPDPRVPPIKKGVLVS
jgi:hypothetical protein